MNDIYPWQHSQWQALVKRIESKRLPHALLLVGLPGMGKRHFAKQLATGLLCQNPHQGLGCKTCKSCLLLEADNHPSYSLIEPEASDKPLKIEQIRNLTQFLATTPQFTDYKVAMIVKAEALNTAAANALLKTLEEPQGQTLLILLSQADGLLPATIRSRCQAIHFPPALDQDTQRWLAKHLAADSDELLRSSGGAPLAAIALQEQLPYRHELWKKLVSIAEYNISPLELAATHQKIQLVDFLTWLQELIIDMIKLNLTDDAQFINNKIFLPQLQKLALCAKLSRLYACIDELQSARQQLAAHINLNHQLLLERILYQWQNCWTDK